VTTKYLSVVFTGEDKSATKTFKKVDDAADDTQTKLSKLGEKIGRSLRSPPLLASRSVSRQS
jgi:hypothetical protein